MQNGDVWSLDWEGWIADQTDMVKFATSFREL